LGSDLLDLLGLDSLSFSRLLLSVVSFMISTSVDESTDGTDDDDDDGIVVDDNGTVHLSMIIFA
jgi:hypothetical protein